MAEWDVPCAPAVRTPAQLQLGAMALRTAGQCTSHTTATESTAPPSSLAAPARQRLLHQSTCEIAGASNPPRPRTHRPRPAPPTWRSVAVAKACSVFASARASMSSLMRSSTLPAIRKRVTTTGCVWPRRCARPMAWTSREGLRLGSICGAAYVRRVMMKRQQTCGVCGGSYVCVCVGMDWSGACGCRLGGRGMCSRAQLGSCGAASCSRGTRARGPRITIAIACVHVVERNAASVEEA